MESEVVEAELVLPTYLSFKRVQIKRMRNIPKAKPEAGTENILSRFFKLRTARITHLMNPIMHVNIESPPSIHQCKRICDTTGFEAPYYDPVTKLRYANTEVFKTIRSLLKEVCKY